MDSFSTAFARDVAKQINDAIAREREALDTGVAIASMEAYREKVGRIYAYREVLNNFMPRSEEDVTNPPSGDR